jgi:hypothetical protein
VIESTSMAELLLSLYSPQQCHADLPFEVSDRTAFRSLS